MEIALFVAISIGVGLLWRGSRDDAPHVVRRKLAQRTVQSLAQLAEGKQGTTSGTVEMLAGATVESPLQRRACVYWRIVIDELGASDYVELGRLEEGVPFLLRTDRGAARVVPEHVSVALSAETWRMQHTLYGTAVTGMFGTLLGRVKKPNHPGSDVRFTEYILEPGAVATASGWISRETDPEGADDVSGYREALPSRPVISGTKRERLLIATAEPTARSSSSS